MLFLFHLIPAEIVSRFIVFFHLGSDMEQFFGNAADIDASAA